LYGLKTDKNINIQSTDFYDPSFLLGRQALLPMLVSPFPSPAVCHSYYLHQLLCFFMFKLNLFSVCEYLTVSDQRVVLEEGGIFWLEHHTDKKKTEYCSNKQEKLSQDFRTILLYIVPIITSMLDDVYMY